MSAGFVSGVVVVVEGRQVVWRKTWDNRESNDESFENSP